MKTLIVTAFCVAVMLAIANKPANGDTEWITFTSSTPAEVEFDLISSTSSQVVFDVEIPVVG